MRECMKARFSLTQKTNSDAVRPLLSHRRLDVPIAGPASSKTIPPGPAHERDAKAGLDERGRNEKPLKVLSPTMRQIFSDFRGAIDQDAEASGNSTRWPIGKLLPSSFTLRKVGGKLDLCHLKIAV
jgi:hypothetical protein